MTRHSAELMADVYPDVPLTRELHGHETLLAIDRLGPETLKKVRGA